MNNFFKPMLPCMRSDIGDPLELIGDFFHKMFCFIVIAFITAAIWLLFTAVIDKEMSRQKYHYWPWRPDAEISADSAEVVRQQLQQQVLQLQQMLQTLPAPATTKSGNGGKASRGSSRSTQGNPTQKPRQVNVSRMYFRDGARVIVPLGSTYQLHLAVEPENHNEGLSVSVAKANGGIDVISVSPSYVITALRRGTVLVLVTSERTKKEASVFVEVR